MITCLNRNSKTKTMINLCFLYNNCTAFVHIWEGFWFKFIHENTNGTIGKWYNGNELHLAVFFSRSSSNPRFSDFFSRKKNKFREKINFSREIFHEKKTKFRRKEIPAKNKFQLFYREFRLFLWKKSKFLEKKSKFSRNFDFFSRKNSRWKMRFFFSRIFSRRNFVFFPRIVTLEKKFFREKLLESAESGFFVCFYQKTLFFQLLWMMILNTII